ncbi:Diaminopimelate epimerase-like protein [Obba rivulosa]|uniref:trans-L-3-hydroxyproline dehydratase n=1 Tax=Obba rivulosa TaxID=1052685 RepID=A0A8E2DKI1_9APHY|nr:Diaminopimelate epimerase-like protein [Obba rivulosa]
MDIWADIASGRTTLGDSGAIRTVDMHTCGEPTRIVIGGYPFLEGQTLLEKRVFARDHADGFRKRQMLLMHACRLMWEPRGHREMYGAILVKETELTASGEADIGVLFCHNEGYSTMCGHATIALGRFLVDTQSETVFPRRHQLAHEAEKREMRIRLHAPCGVVQVTVPTEEAAGVLRADTTRPVTFISVASWVAATDVVVPIPERARWNRLVAAARTSVRVDVAYGGAFYAIVSAQELGFAEGLARAALENLAELDAATAAIKAQLAGRAELFEHPDTPDLEYLYGVVVVDTVDGAREELGLCFFADQQIDRSPCGSGVSARVALAVARDALALGESRVFHSPLSLAHAESAFCAFAAASERVRGRRGREWAGVRVSVSGRGFYTGAHAFVAEDALSASGFLAAGA